MPSRLARKTFWMFFFCVLLVVILVCSTSYQVGDPDIGWHLADGLWIFDHGQIPAADPFGADSSRWVSYSWLFDVMLAFLWQKGGFPALGCFQILLSCVLVIVLFVAISTVYSSPDAQRKTTWNSPFGSLFLAFLAICISALFLFPSWNLRPHVLSVIFFSVILALAECEALISVTTVVLTILWCNIHVYWVLSPAIVFLYTVMIPLLKKDMSSVRNGLVFSLIVGLSTAVNPYGFKLHSTIFDYALKHDVAYQLVVEFRRLSPGSVGPLFWVFVVLVLGGSVFFLTQPTKRTLALGAVFFALAFLSWRKLKFLLLFGVVTAFTAYQCLARVLGRFQDRDVSSQKSVTSSRPRRVTLRTKLLFGLLLAVSLFIPLLRPTFTLPTALPERNSSLIPLVHQLYQRLGPQPGNSPLFALNHFDDGGWIDFVLYLESRHEKNALAVRTTIDGRTLVMGEQRLLDFARLQSDEAFCEILAKWHPDIAILSTDHGLLKNILGENPAVQCESRWRSCFANSSWVIVIPGNSPLANICEHEDHPDT